MILISIGRNPSNKIVITNQSVSSYHAELKVRDDGSIYITDKSSMNGTFVKGKRIQNEIEVSVNRGEKITFAGVTELNWSMVPIITPPPIGWKLYSIGSDLNNRIQINDSSNSVSRFHATLKIDTKGKVYINDHSSNGTFVNGNKIASNQDIPVKRKDKIVFANNIPFDWSKIKEKPTIPSFQIAASIAAVLIIGLGIWQFIENKRYDLAKINKEYGRSVVCVIHKYGMYANVVYTNGESETLGVIISDEPLSEEYIDYGVSGNINNELNAYIYLVDPKSKAYPLTKKATSGTAFFVDNQGTMITNRHITIPWEEEAKICTEIVKNKGVKRIYGETESIGIALNGRYITKWTDFEDCTILSSSTDEQNKDIGLLRTKNIMLPDDKIKPINMNKVVTNNNKIKVGDNVFMLGYPLGIQMFKILDDKTTTNAIEIKTTGQEGKITQSPDKYKFGHNAPTIGGASGSPMFNDKGELIGVLNAGLTAAHGYNWSILAKHAKELYDKE